MLHRAGLGTEEWSAVAVAKTRWLGVGSKNTAAWMRLGQLQSFLSAAMQRRCDGGVWPEPGLEEEWRQDLTRWELRKVLVKCELQL